MSQHVFSRHELVTVVIGVECTGLSHDQQTGQIILYVQSRMLGDAVHVEGPIRHETNLQARCPQ